MTVALALALACLGCGEHCISGAPASLQSSADSSGGDRGDLAPLNQTEGSLADRNHSVTPMVTVLLLVRSPSTVTGFVVPIIVLSIDAVSARWPGAHVGEEVFKTLPSLADLYPSSAVVCELLVVGIRTSLPHRRPDPIFRRHSPVPGLSMLQANSCAMGHPKFATKTAARLGGAIPHQHTRDFALGSAVTDAMPSDGSLRLVDLSDHDQSAKSFPRHIDSLRHGDTLAQNVAFWKEDRT